MKKLPIPKYKVGQVVGTRYQYGKGEHSITLRTITKIQVYTDEESPVYHFEGDVYRYKEEELEEVYYLTGEPNAT